MDTLLYYLAILACPLMMIGMFYFMSKMMNSNSKEKDVNALKTNMRELAEQNERLMKEVHSLKDEKKVL